MSEQVIAKPGISKRTRPSPSELKTRLAERGCLEVFASVARIEDIPLDRLLDLWCIEPRVIEARCEAFLRTWELLNLSSEQLAEVFGYDRSHVSWLIRRAFDLRRERARSRVA